MASETYAQMLAHPNWQKRRLEIMHRDGFVCRLCKDGETTLNVHHQFYLKRAKPWEYDDTQLITLCAPCHEKTTGLLERLKRGLSRLNPRSLERPIGYVETLELRFDFASATDEMMRGCAEAWGSTVEEMFGPQSISDLGTEE